jgi:phenylacetate-coenzyme A ligase PaaK-like adenylate-forming protein
MQTRTNPASEREAAVARLLSHAAMYSPYYRDQAWARSFRNGKMSEFSDLPFTHSSSVKVNTSAFYSSYVPSSDGPVIDKFTSGSIGEPAKIKKTRTHFSINADENRRLRQGWGFGRQTGFVQTQSPPKDGPPGEVVRSSETTNSWKIYSREPRPTIELLCRTRCSHVSLYPSQAVSILELKPSLDFLRLISTVGEVVPPELTKLIAGLPDCAHYDSYGSVETGIIAGKCSQCGNYHIADRHLIVEILDEDDRPVAPGGMGRVVVTPLYNLAMPLLRFELGDFAEIALDTGCSRSRYSLTRIVGREKNLFRLPDGSRVVPMLAAYDVIALGVREYKLLQRSPLEIDFIYVPRSPEVVLTETDVQPLITRNFSPLIKASPVRVTAIPRSTSGKFLMHESLVPTA